ncbi:MAG: hypothetical protein HKN19_19910, partial [Halioglobus sp.]|nr:hypothetical protein [Halioglobus sp.]
EQRDAYRREFTAEFEAELQGLPASVHTVLISSEHFHSRIRTEEEMDNVHAFFSRYFDDIKIVCYLREQGVTCSSYYSTSLKSGGPISFEDFMLRCAPTNYYFNYLDMLANWERCFGFDALDVALFSREHWERGDLLEDFAKKISPDLVGKLDTSIQAENESLSPAGQALMRAVNMVFPGRTARAEVDPIRDKCRKLIYDKLRGPGQRLQLSSHLHVFDSFRESNEALRKKFFPDVEVIFPEPTEAGGVDASLPDAFVDVQIAVLNVLRKDGKGIVTPDEITDFITALGRSINEIVNPGEANMEEAKDVALTRQDARILKRAAQGYEKRNPEMAYQLLSLSEKADATIPGIHHKLEQYQREREIPTRQQYFVRSFVDRESPDWDPEKLNHDLLYGWYASFQDQIVGAMVNRLDETTSLGPVTRPEDADIAVDGFTIIEADSREEIEEIASRCPLLQVGGSVEVSALSLLVPGMQSAVK